MYIFLVGVFDVFDYYPHSFSGFHDDFFGVAFLVASNFFWDLFGVTYETSASQIL